MVHRRRAAVRRGQAGAAERAVFPEGVLLLPDGVQPAAALGLDLQAIAAPAPQP